MSREVSPEKKLIGCFLIFFSILPLSFGLVILSTALLGPLISGGKIALWPTGAGIAFVLAAALLVKIGLQYKSPPQPRPPMQPGDRPAWIPAAAVQLLIKGSTKRWLNFWLTWLAATFVCLVLFFLWKIKLKPYFNDIASAATLLIPLALLYIGVIGYTLFRACGPSLFVQMNRREVKPGEKMQLAWELRGMQGFTRRLTIEIIARESLFIYTRGSSRNIRGVKEFVTIPVFETQSPVEMQRHSVDLSVASGSMHSFIASALDSFFANYECRISWAIRFRGDVSYWPDFKDEIDFVLLPE